MGYSASAHVLWLGLCHTPPPSGKRGWKQTAELCAQEENEVGQGDHSSFHQLVMGEKLV